jgi:hypothetical protein
LIYNVVHEIGRDIGLAVVDQDRAVRRRILAVEIGVAVKHTVVVDLSSSNSGRASIAFDRDTVVGIAATTIAGYAYPRVMNDVVIDLNVS